MAHSPDRIDDDEILAGTTLKVYRFMVSRKDPIGPRELQRALHFSSPGLATFHLDKLTRTGLVSKSVDGTFSVDRVFLKHYVRVRRFLIPRYMFYAILSTAFVAGWAIILSFPSVGSRDSIWAGLHTNASFGLLVTFSYGFVISLIVTVVFWYETFKVLQNDKI